MLRRATKITVEVFAVLLTGLAIAVGAAAWRLSSGPIALDSLSPYIQRALTPASGEFRVRVEHTILTWGGWQRPVVVHAVGLRAIRPDGDLIARVPRATIRFSTRALLRGIVAPTSLDIQQPTMIAERTRDGRFTFGLGGAGKDAKGKVRQRAIPLPRAVIDGLLSDKREGALSYLNSVRITAARMTIFDRHLELAWRAPEANLEFTRGPAGIRISADMTVAIRGQQIQLRGAGIYARANRTAEASVTFFGLKPSLFAQRDAKSAGRVGLNHLSALRIALNGRVDFALGRDGRVTRFGFELGGADGKIVLPKPNTRSLIVKSLSLRGHMTDNFTKLAVDRLSVDFGGPVLMASGVVDNIGKRATAKLKTMIRKIKVNELESYWPAGFATGGRRWVLANIRDGDLPEIQASLEMAFGGGREPSFNNVRGAFLYGGLSVSFLKGLPPVSDVTGSGTFTQNGIDFRVVSGRLDGLTIYETSVRLVGMNKDDPRQQRIIIAAAMRGPLHQTLKILDREPLRYATKMGVSPSAASGRALIRLQVEFPLLDALTMDEVYIKSQTKLENFAWRGGLYGVNIKGGSLKLDVDKTEMVVKGSVRVGSQQARVNWVERFDGDTQIRRRIIVEGLANDEIRRAFGLALSPFVRGPLKMRLQLTKQSGRAAERVEARFDLAGASLSLPFLGWNKAAGTPGKAMINVTMRRGRVIAINALAFEAAGLKANGSAKMTKDGKGLQELKLKRVVLGRSDVALSVSARESGGYLVSVSGRSVDGERFFDGERNSKPGPSKGPRPDLAIQFGVNRIYFGKTNYMSNFRGRAARIGGRWTIIHFDGRVPSGRPVRVRFAQRGPGRALVIQSTDAGGTLKALGIMDNVVGGTLDVRGIIVDNKEEPFQGRMVMRNYRLVKAPILRRITSQGSLEKTAGTLAKPRGVLFSEFVAPFTYRHRRGRLRVSNGRAISPNLGVTFEGAIDLRKERLEIDGTVVPAYSLNSVLGKVPLVGQLLVGEKHGGIFAAAYTAEGPLRKPTLKVHPLSVLTPGLLRRLWRKFNDDGPKSAEVPILNDR